MASLRRIVPLLLVALGLLVLVRSIASRPIGDVTTPQHVPSRFQDNAGVNRVNQWIENRWRIEQVTPVKPAEEINILRRLSLALHGTVPSLEELRQFETDRQPDRLKRWTQRMLGDDRFPTYFAERLSRALVGTEVGPFLAFRRDRFRAWLDKQLASDRPWDQIVTELVSASGLPTGRPATNFITITMVDGDVDQEKLAGRSIRAFLGQRIDCAQCHDHPFDPRWKQPHFQGLAAFFGAARVTALGVDDAPGRIYEVTDPSTQQTREIVPAVPSGSDWLPGDGNSRQRLAAWLTHRENDRFDRAIVNRIWGLLFGQPFFSPVDDLPDPGDPDTELLSVLARDFQDHGRDLKWLIHTIAASRPFGLGSQADDATIDELNRLEAQWAIFPLVRLRPEQVIGSMLQAASIKTVDRNSHLLIRTVRFFRENDFVQEYGDLGDEELAKQTGTIPQALLRMNGRLGRDLIESNAFSASAHIARVTEGDDATCLASSFLVCLGRRPLESESRFFRKWLTETRGDRRVEVVEDIFWALFNSPEFSWNH